MKALRGTGCTGIIVDRALTPNSMVNTSSSGSLQMVDHTLIAVSFASVYLDSPYYKGRTLQSDKCQLPGIPCENW